MISRIWHGWTTPENADVYEELLKSDSLSASRPGKLPVSKAFIYCAATWATKWSLSPSCGLAPWMRCAPSPGKIMKMRLCLQKPVPFSNISTYARSITR